jgi:hypothetical protein
MKHYLNILLVVFLTTSLAADNTNQANYTFTIHVGAFVNPKLTDFDNIRPFGYLYTQPFNNLLQVYMGDYPTESDASKILTQIKESGYPDAFVTRRNLDTGSSDIIIQLGFEKVGADIDWGYYTNAGSLQTFQSGNTIQIATESFEDLTAANRHLELIKKSGFDDAFIKNINSVLLHKVTSFETGDLQIPRNYEEGTILATPDKEVVIAEIPAKKTSIPGVIIKKKTPTDLDAKKEEPMPKAYEDVLVAKSPSSSPIATTSTEKAVNINEKKAAINSLATPDIRSDVKRTSVLRLQEVLKTKGSYKSSLDGLFGPGTRKSLNDMMANDQEIKKYKLLSQIYKNDNSKISDLQVIVFEMNDDIAVGVSKLKRQKSALSKAYQAYGIFALSGKNKETDKLMNQAIKESFVGKKFQNKPTFDFNTEYSYSDYGKLIRHLKYIHSASQEDIVVPCWLFEKHQKEAIAAFEPSATSDFKIQDCGNITQWESIALMEVIMKEMTPDLSKLDPGTLANLQSKRALLMLTPKTLTTEDYKKIDTWNTNLWNGLLKWETADPLHCRMITPLKVAYFQSWALLEDHFMNQGFTAKDARGLSLCVLETIVEPYLGKYSE